MRIEIIDNGVKREIDTNSIKIGSINLAQFLDKYKKLSKDVAKLKKQQETQDKAFIKASKVLGDG
jgi:hypothetical protein